MTKINNITVIDEQGKVTEAGVRLQELVHEALGIGCWHKGIKAFDHPRRESLPNSYESTVFCIKCDMYTEDYRKPRYLTSLDALMPVLNQLSDEQKEEHDDKLNQIEGNLNFFGWEHSPHHHVEALARVLTVECGEKHCKKGLVCDPDDECIEDCDIDGCACPTCKGEGRITILELWEGEYATDNN